MNADIRARLEHLLATSISQVTPLSGGQMAAVYAVSLEPPFSGVTQAVSNVVVKVDPEGDLACEGRMLQYLRDKAVCPCRRYTPKLRACWCSSVCPVAA